MLYIICIVVDLHSLINERVFKFVFMPWSERAILETKITDKQIKYE